MEDVATESGMSRSLVSLVFQDSPKVSPASRERVLAAAHKLGYRPNAIARSLASTRTNTIGVLLDDLHNPFFADALDAIEDAAEAQGYRVLQTSGRRDGAREMDAIRTFIDHRVDGLILVAPRFNDDELAKIAKVVPTVVLGRRVQRASSKSANSKHQPTKDGQKNETSAGTRVDVIIIDERIAGELVVNHLVSLGHSEIAHIDGGGGPGAEARAQGYLDAMKLHGLTPRVLSGAYTEEAGQQAARELLNNKHMPTAIICAADITAAGVAAEFAANSLTVPVDVSLVSFDNTALAQLSLLSLTSVEQPLQQMASDAVELISARLDDPKRTPEVHELAPKLIVRSSTSAPKKR